MGWRRNTACLGGLLLLLLLRRCRRRQIAALLFTPSPYGRLLHYWRVLKAEDSDSRGGRLLAGGFFISVFKSLLDLIRPYRRLIRPVSVPPSCLMESTSPSDQATEVQPKTKKRRLRKRATEVDCNSDGPLQPEDGVSRGTTTQEGLEKEEPKTLDPEPHIISMDDPHQISGARCFFMKTVLPRTAWGKGVADCSLIEWLSAREGRGIRPLATYKVSGSSAPVNYVRDEVKVLIKSVIQFIQHLHNEGQCTNGTFKPKNIYVVGETLKFDKLELSRFSKELQEKDYNCVYSMIQTIILRKKTNLLPYDMQQFLKLLKNPRPHTYLIRKHVALMNLSSCRDFILLLWDKKETMNPTVLSKWQNAIEDLSGIDCWSRDIAEDSPLFEVYKGDSYVGSDKTHLIRFFRNAAAHLSDHSCKGEKSQFEHISLIITASFPKVMADLQERLNHHGVLQELL